MKTEQTILVIEDNINHFNKIKKSLEANDWEVIPKVKTQTELTEFLFGIPDIGSFNNRKDTSHKIKEQILNFITQDKKYEYISCVILDIQLSTIEDDINPQEGYSILNGIRSMFISNSEYRGWNKIIPIIILSQYRESVKLALKGKAITNLCLNKEEVFYDKALLANYIEHLFNYFDIVKNNLLDFNLISTKLSDIDTKLEDSYYRLDEISDNIDDLLANTSFLIEAAFSSLSPSQRQELIDRFDEYLPKDVKDRFEATYFEKLKEDMKKNVDNIELFVKTLEYAPITIFTTLRDVIMNFGLYK